MRKKLEHHVPLLHSAQLTQRQRVQATAQRRRSDAGCLTPRHERPLAEVPLAPERPVAEVPLAPERPPVEVPLAEIPLAPDASHNGTTAPERLLAEVPLAPERPLAAGSTLCRSISRSSCQACSGSAPFSQALIAARSSCRARSGSAPSPMASFNESLSRLSKSSQGLRHYLNGDRRCTANWQPLLSGHRCCTPNRRLLHGFPATVAARRTGDRCCTANRRPLHGFPARAHHANWRP